MPFLRKKKVEEAPKKSLADRFTGGTLSAVAGVIRPDSEEAQNKTFLKRVEDLPQLVKSDLCLKTGVLFLGLFLLIGIIHLVSVTKTSDPQEKRNVIVSMDGDPGDFLGLEYLARRPDINVAMIILTGNGWTSSLGAFTNTFANFFSAPCPKPAPPVYSGASFASAAGNTNCTYRRVVDPLVLLGHDAAWNVPDSPQRYNKLLEAGAPDLYVNPLYNYLNKAAPGSVDFLVFGPLTDIAWYFEAKPQHANRVRRIMLDGGVVTSGQGNLKGLFPPNTASEWNLFFDPTSAEYLIERTAPELKTKFNVELFPLEASRRCASNEKVIYSPILKTNAWLSDLLDRFTLVRSEEGVASEDWPLSNSLYMVSQLAPFKGQFAASNQWLYFDVANPIQRPGSATGTNLMLETAGSLSYRTSSFRVENGQAVQASRTYLGYDCAGAARHVAAVASMS